MTADERLAELGLELPEIPALPFVPRLRPVVVHGGLAYLSGIGPAAAGRVGAELSVEEGYAAARDTALLVFRRIVDELGALERVERWVKVLGFIRSAPDFGDQPSVRTASASSWSRSTARSAASAPAARSACRSSRVASRSRSRRSLRYADLPSSRHRASSPSRVHLRPRQAIRTEDEQVNRRNRRIVRAGVVSTLLVVAFAALGAVGFAAGLSSAAAQYQYQGAKKVTICHKQKNTITVSENAVKAHLAHGDTLGKCANGHKKNKGKHKGESNHAPNPATGTGSEGSATSGGSQHGNGNGKGK